MTDERLPRVLYPLAVVLGVGLDHRLGDALLPPLWRSSASAQGTWVWAGGRVALAPDGSWGVAAAVVLAAEMADAAEGLAYAHSVVARVRTMQATRVTHAHPYALTEGAPAEIDRVVRAAAAVLLSEGYVTEVRDEYPAEPRPA